MKVFAGENITGGHYDGTLTSDEKNIVTKTIRSVIVYLDRERVFRFRYFAITLITLGGAPIREEVLQDENVSHGNEQNANSLQYRPPEHSLIELLCTLATLSFAQTMMRLIVQDAD